MDVDLFDLSVPFDWLLELFEGSGSRPAAGAPTAVELEELLAGVARRFRVDELARIERERRNGRINLSEFRRRYARVARREPAEDPAHLGVYGPDTAAVERFLAAIGAIAPRDWAAPEEHMRNLLANPVVRGGLVPCYRSALEAAVATARLSAVAAAEEAIGARVPGGQETGTAWRRAVPFLALGVVLGDRFPPAYRGLVAPLGP